MGLDCRSHVVSCPCFSLYLFTSSLSERSSVREWREGSGVSCSFSFLFYSCSLTVSLSLSLSFRTLLVPLFLWVICPLRVFCATVFRAIMIHFPLSRISLAFSRIFLLLLSYNPPCLSVRLPGVTVSERERVIERCVVSEIRGERKVGGKRTHAWVEPAAAAAAKKR